MSYAHLMGFQGFSVLDAFGPLHAIVYMSDVVNKNSNNRTNGQQ